ncbi:hypothetical protein FM114_15115 [Luteococcus japonicus LSP_Lj1]|uniref:Uncharacterized protein n=1 Tax=Luteococcus japonicus LSP_Lj1 TaxID=1255658 RepID=A0A1R4KJM9_9ACTN|nr:hypothetical protein FM114_15115 [Luteococcus japonicus LSP_Lj1]
MAPPVRSVSGGLGCLVLANASASLPSEAGVNPALSRNGDAPPFYQGWG